MKRTLILLLTLTLSANILAGITSLEVINEGLRKIHNGNHPVALLEDKADFIGFDIAGGRLKWAMDSINQTESLEDFALEGGAETKFVKDSYFTEAKVQRIVKRLKNKCARFLNKINKDNQYYCSDIFVYSGDVSDPTTEGRYHKAVGQKGFDFIDAKEKLSKPAATRLKLASNNEPFANYDVYIIGIMEKE